MKESQTSALVTVQGALAVQSMSFGNGRHHAHPQDAYRWMGTYFRPRETMSIRFLDHLIRLEVCVHGA